MKSYRRKYKKKKHPDWYSGKRTPSNKMVNMRVFLRVLKAVPCADCYIQYPHYVMQFDHVRGTKKFELSQAISGGRKLEEILAEVAKCEVVCANCHAERTYLRSHQRQEEGKDKA